MPSILGLNTGGAIDRTPRSGKKGRKGSLKSVPTSPTILHTKRKEIVDEEGWTHVIDAPQRSPKGRGGWRGKGRGGGNANAAKPNLQKLLHGGDFEINGVSYINRTLEEIKSDYAYWKKHWEEDEACADLKGKLSEGGEGRRRVDNVVCLGLGSAQSFRREGRRATATQLAALETIVEVLGREMKVVVQDPQFTELDKKFLGGLGYTVVEDPEAFAAITEKSLVYGIHCYANLYKTVGDGPRPAVLVGTDVGNFGKFNSSITGEEITQSLEDMVEGCEELDFPQIRHDFSDTKIYWRKTTSPATNPVPAQSPQQDAIAKDSEAVIEASKEAKSPPTAEPPNATTLFGILQSESFPKTEYKDLSVPNESTASEALEESCESTTIQPETAKDIPVTQKEESFIEEHSTNTANATTLFGILQSESFPEVGSTELETRDTPEEERTVLPVKVIEETESIALEQVVKCEEFENTANATTLFGILQSESVKEDAAHEDTAQEEFVQQDSVQDPCAREDLAPQDSDKEIEATTTGEYGSEKESHVIVRVVNATTLFGILQSESQEECPSPEPTTKTTLEIPNAATLFGILESES